MASKPRDDWECERGPYHLLDDEEISMEVGTGIVTFHCANCQKSIHQKPLKECSKEVQEAIFDLVTTPVEGGWTDIEDI